MDGSRMLSAGRGRRRLASPRSRVGPIHRPASGRKAQGPNTTVPPVGGGGWGGNVSGTLSDAVPCSNGPQRQNPGRTPITSRRPTARSGRSASDVYSEHDGRCRHLPPDTARTGSAGSRGSAPRAATRGAQAAAGLGGDRRWRRDPAGVGGVPWPARWGLAFPSERNRTDGERSIQPAFSAQSL